MTLYFRITGVPPVVAVPRDARNRPMKVKLSYPRTHRLSSPPRFKAVYDARVRETRGPLAIHALPNSRNSAC